MKVVLDYNDVQNLFNLTSTQIIKLDDGNYYVSYDSDLYREILMEYDKSKVIKFLRDKSIKDILSK